MTDVWRNGPNDDEFADDAVEDYDRNELNVTSRSFATICFLNKTLGIAVYDEVLNTVYADSVVAALGDREDILTSLKSCCSISLWLIHPKILTEPGLIEFLTAGLDGSADFYKYQVLKNSQWSAEGAMDAIENKLIVNNKKVSYLWVSTLIDMDSTQLRQALGALILYMQQNSFQLDNGLVTVAAVKKLSLKSYMRIDDASKKALQIFSQEFHPNVLSGCGRGKEGFSLFGLLDRTRSIPGRHMLRDWMRKPLYDLEKILHRQDGIQFVIRSENADIICELAKCLRKIHSIPQLLVRIRRSEATYKEWVHLFKSLQNGLTMIEYIIMFINQDRHRDDISWLSALLEGLDVDVCRDSLELLHSCIDIEGSVGMKQLAILPGYDAVLDYRRQLYDNLESIMTDAARKVLDIQPLLQNVSVEYMSQVGYLVAISVSEAHCICSTEKFSQQAQAKKPRIMERDNTWWSPDEENIEPNVDYEFEFIFERNGFRFYKHMVVRGELNTILPE
jgi:DNA mismatch repair ATPase MutS